MITSETCVWLVSLVLVSLLGWLVGYGDGVRRSRRRDDE